MYTLRKNKISYNIASSTKSFENSANIHQVNSFLDENNVETSNIQLDKYNDETNGNTLEENLIKTTTRDQYVPPIFCLKKRANCPAYKIIEGTTFAVDAFRFGDIDGVSHYFLTHYHCDHFIGLKKSFAKPLVLSKITGKKIELFFSLKIVILNQPQL